MSTMMGGAGFNACRSLRMAAGHSFSLPPIRSLPMPFRLRYALVALVFSPAFVAGPASGPASAQMFGFSVGGHPRPIPPRGVYAIAPHHALMPPGMALAVLGDQGFRAVGRVVLRGEALVVAALDPRGRPVTVIMDAYDGEILNVVPRAMAAPEPQPRIMTAPKPAPNPGARVISVQPPVRPKQLAVATPAVPAAVKPAVAAYPPPEAGALRKLSRQAD
ncbi:MAG: hypothetical protein ACRCWO_09070 [Bosea sp. (in: a-proteobacteria)]